MQLPVPVFANTALQVDGWWRSVVAAAITPVAGSRPTAPLPEIDPFGPFAPIEPDVKLIELLTSSLVKAKMT